MSDSFVILQVGSGLNTDYYLNAVYHNDYGVGGGVASSAYLNRYWSNASRASAASKGFYGTYFALFEPHAFLDTRGLSYPFILRFQDTVVVRHVAATEKVAWGLGSWVDATDIVTSLQLLGFTALNGGNWHAVVKDSATTWLDIDTGKDSASIHVLQMDLDGSSQSVIFSIDRVEVARYRFVAPNLLGQVDAGLTGVRFGISAWNEIVPTGSGQIYAGGGWNPTVQLIVPSTVVATGPDQPTLAVASVGVTEVELTGSVYSHPDGVAQKLSVWQLDVPGGDFSVPLKELISEVGLTDIQIPGLEESTTYIVRVMYVDTNFTPSQWSDAIAFSTTEASTDFTSPDPCSVPVFTEVDS